MVKVKKQFRHHPDGWIYVNDLSIPLEDFEKLEPEYKLEKGWIGREYFQGEFHRIYDGKNEKFLDKNWKEGDKYIKNYLKYKAYLKKKEKEVVKITNEKQK